MVLLPLQFAPDGWEALRGAATPTDCARLNLAKSTAATAGGPVLLFVAAGDVDAIAAVKVLTALLKADLTRYEVHPVSGYSHLARKFRDLAQGVQPRAVLFINCGAMVDLEFVLGGEDGLESDLRLFVMDCHRPYHLKNIRSERVALFDDVNEVNYDMLPLDVDWEDEWGNVFESSDDDDDDNDSEEEREASVGSDSDDSLAASIRKRKRHRRRKLVDDIEDDDVVFDDEERSPSDEDKGSDAEGDEEEQRVGERENDRPRSPRRRKRRKRTRRAPRRGRRRHPNDPETIERRRLIEYYANATIAMSSACLSHSIAAVLRRSNIDTLWMAITGVTSQYINSTISHDLYADSLGYFEEQIKALSQEREEEEEGTSHIANVGYVPTCNSYQLNRIAPSEELRLDLLRHWSLYESLLYSTYTATRLSAWRQTGKRRMLEMLATLGIPLKESQQQWCYMKAKNKRALEKHFEMVVRRFDLGENVQYDSFVRSLPGHRGDISAADFGHAISVLLEFDEPTRRDPSSNTPRTLELRFWTAYDALDPRKTTLLDTGLDMAILIQKLTTDIGGDVIERRKFVPSGPFRYVFLRDQQRTEFLAHPLLLRRLALFLIKSLIRQGAKDKPFIILAPNHSKEEWLAVAATTSSQQNDFGHRFRKAAEKNGSEVVYDGFDSAMCKIKDGQEIEFVRFLHDVMR